VRRVNHPSSLGPARLLVPVEEGACDGLGAFSAQPLAIYRVWPPLTLALLDADEPLDPEARHAAQ